MQKLHMPGSGDPARDRLLELGEVALNGVLVEDGQCCRWHLARELPTSQLADFVLEEDGVEALLLPKLAPVVLLGGAPVLARRQPQLELYAALDVAPLGARLQLVPTLEAGARDVLEGQVDAAQEIVLAAGARALGDLLEESPEALDPAHLVQLYDGVENRELVVVVPGGEGRCCFRGALVDISEGLLELKI